NNYYKSGRYDEAAADYAKAIALKPDYAQAYSNRAWAYHLKGEEEKALADAEKAVSLLPKAANSFGTRAAIYEKLGKRSEAIEDYRMALMLEAHHQSAEDGLKRLGAAP